MCPCTPGTGAGERLDWGCCPDLQLSGLVPQAEAAGSAPSCCSRAGTSCACGVHGVFGSSRGTAGPAIWQFLSGYLASDALTVLAKSCSTESYVVPAGPLLIAI